MEKPMDDAWLLEKIVETTKDKKSFRFWLKAIKELGPGIVNEELGELLHQMRLGKVKHPERYLTALLQKQLEKQKQGLIPTLTTDEKKENEKLQQHFEETQMTLFKNLTPQKTEGAAEPKAMEVPYGKENIPWATFISSSFFD